MKKFFFVIVFICYSCRIFAQSEKQNIYSGGMLFLQPGYFMSNNNHQNINELSMGIGGVLRFYFFKNFTTGIYGGTQKANYSTNFSNNSYINLGYGGIFMGITHKVNKIRLTLSFFGGKGSVNNLHIEKQNNTLLNEAYLYKSSTTIFSPILSCDYALTQRISATIQIVFLNSNFQSNLLQIPIIQFGILFNR